MQEHCTENSHQQVWLKNFEIICRSYGNQITQKISKVSIINRLKPTLNKKKG